MPSIFDISSAAKPGLTALAQAAAPAPAPAPAPTPTPTSLSSLNANTAVIPSLASPSAPPSPDAALVDLSLLPSPPLPGSPPEELTAYLLTKLRLTRASLTHGRDTLLELHSHLREHPSILPPEALGDITHVMHNLTVSAHKQATHAKAEANTKATAKAVKQAEMDNLMDGIDF